MMECYKLSYAYFNEAIKDKNQHPETINELWNALIVKFQCLHTIYDASDLSYNYSLATLHLLYHETNFKGWNVSNSVLKTINER